MIFCYNRPNLQSLNMITLGLKLKGTGKLLLFTKNITSAELIFYSSAPQIIT